jgi:hypothetical protein
VDVGWHVKAQPGMTMLMVVPGEEGLAMRPRVLDGGEPGGEVRPVLQRLELALGVRVVVGDVRAGVRLGIPGSASRNATGLEVIEEPRSAWMVSCPGPMPCLAQVSAISFSASAADSRVAAIQPGAYRLKTSMITYR